MRLKVIWRAGWAHIDGTGPDGQRVRRALKTRDAVQAEEARAHLEARLWKEGIYGAEAVVTFEQAALAYAEDGGETRFLMPVAAHFTGKLVRSITPKDIRDAARAIYPKAKASTQNRQAIAPASAVINYAHSQGWCGPIKVKRLAEEKPIRQAVGSGYLDALRPHTPPHLWAMLLFMHTTGRRIGEAVDLLRADCDFAARTALIRTTKNDEPIRVALPEDTAAAMQALPEWERVFGYITRTAPRNTLKRACARAGVAYLGTHQPGRHSFATRLKIEGMDSRIIAGAGGWKSPKMVDEVYTHVPDASKLAAAMFDTKLSRTKPAGG